MEWTLTLGPAAIGLVLDTGNWRPPDPGVWEPSGRDIGVKPPPPALPHEE